MTKGSLVIISGPSGSGKGTITNELAKEGDIVISVSATTRSPREGEEHGVHYHFLDKEEFENRLNNGGMLEHNKYCDNYYGTPKAEVENMLCDGKDVILEIDVNGGKQICEKMHAIKIFVIPPDMQVLKERLAGRGTESDEVIEQRLSEAQREIKHAYDYDYIVINDNLDKAVLAVKSILTAQRYKEENMEQLLKEF